MYVLHIYMYIYMCHIYIYMYVCMCVYIYIYIIVSIYPAWIRWLANLETNLPNTNHLSIHIFVMQLDLTIYTIFDC